MKELNKNSVVISIIVASVIVCLLLGVFISYRLGRVQVAVNRAGSGDTQLSFASKVCYFFSIINEDNCSSLNTNMGNDLPGNDSNNGEEVVLAKDGDFVLMGKYHNDRWGYTLKGILPNPCYTMDYDYVIEESLPEKILMTVEISSPSSSTICVQMVKNVSEAGEIVVSKNASFSLKVNKKEFVQPVNKIVDHSSTFSPFGGLDKYTMTFKYNPSILELEDKTLSYKDIASIFIWEWIEGDTGVQSMSLNKTLKIGKFGGYDIYRPISAEIKSKLIAGEPIDYMAREKDSNCTGTVPYNGEKLIPPCFFSNSIYPSLITRVEIVFNEDVTDKELNAALVEFDKVVASMTIKKVN